MPNSYFQFKQFRVDQEDCAMKVCTDACVFGAWAASIFSDKITAGQTILDIGSGTGLLSLMLAQQLAVNVYALEIAEPCFGQLTRNLKASRWAERLHSLHGDAREYLAANKHELIISNPPFYENDLIPDHEGKHLAMHSKELTLEALIQVVVRNLSALGHAAILLPYHRSVTFEKMAACHGLHKWKELRMKQTPKHSWFRSAAIYSFQRNTETPIEELSIKDAGGLYTPAFTGLLSSYYLHL